MSKGSSGSQTTVQKSDPWAGVQPYLTGTTNPLTGKQQTPGIYSEASRLYQQNQNMPQAQQDLISQYSPTLAARNQGFGGLVPQMMNIAGGSTATNFSGVNATDAPTSITPQNLNMIQARAAQGSLDPTTAMQQMLSGRPDTQYLDQQAQALTQQANRNLMENIMPQIRGGAQASGQYGGSRQGIAEGLAASRVTQDLAPALTGMYSNALENAQQRMYGTAGQLNQQAESVGTGNVARDLQAQMQNAANQMNQQQFNANLALQNQQMQINQANQNLARQLQGMGAANTATGLQDQTFNQQMQLAGMPQQYQQQQLQNYAGIVQPGAGIGGTSTSTQPLYQNNVGNALAGGMLGNMAAGALGVSGATGAGLGALGGLLLSSRTKKTTLGSVNAENVLASLMSLPVESWYYTEDPTQAPYVGTYAEDFKEAFGVGDGYMINTTNAIGVLMLSVQALAKRVQELETK